MVTGRGKRSAGTGTGRGLRARALFVAAALPPDGVRHIRGRHLAATHVNSLLLVAQVGELPALGSPNMNGSPDVRSAACVGVIRVLQLGTIVLGLVLGEQKRRSNGVTPHWWPAYTDGQPHDQRALHTNCPKRSGGRAATTIGSIWSIRGWRRTGMCSGRGKARRGVVARALQMRE